jgi:hypothetical protein
LNDLIAILVAMADAQSNFDIKGEVGKDGSYKISSPAEITTFSDNIVVSYPFIFDQAPDSVREVVSLGWATMVRQQMQKITAQIVLAALDAGLLVRGGLSRGKLYHHGPVVVGEAMIDAYRLERCAAVSARVAISPRLGEDDGSFVDTDGQRCLDYFTELMLVAEDKHGDALAWGRQRLQAIEAAVRALNESDRRKEAAKWSSFGDKLRSEMIKWPGGASRSL